MKLKLAPQCTSCVLRQLMEACQYATRDTALRYSALQETIRYLGTVDFGRLDVRIGRDLHKIVRKVTGNWDPYSELKKSSNKMALDWFSKNGKTLKDGVSFGYAVRVAAAANIIDYGALRIMHSPKELFAKALKGRVNPKEVAGLERLVKKSNRILYICDNAGEIAFDRLLVSAIQNMGPEVTVAVRGGPIINDATMEDAREVGMTKLARTISTGTDIPGILLEESSPEFLSAFQQSDLIISKGQANLESLINIRGKPTAAYILMVKCKLVSKYLKSKVGSTRIVFQAASSSKR